MCVCVYIYKSQWTRGLRRRSVSARQLRFWVRIPPGASMFVCCEYCVLLSLCDELMTRPEESYRLWCVVVWSRILKNEEAMTRVGPQRHRKKERKKARAHTHTHIHTILPVSVFIWIKHRVFFSLNFPTRFSLYINIYLNCFILWFYYPRLSSFIYLFMCV